MGQITPTDIAALVASARSQCADVSKALDSVEPPFPWAIYASANNLHDCALKLADALEASEKAMGLAMRCLDEFSWEGSSVNHKARMTLNAIREIGSFEDLEFKTLKVVASNAERFEDLVRRHYLQKEAEYDQFYFDHARMSLQQSLKAWRSLRDGEGGET